MRTQIVFGRDAEVGAWMFNVSRCRPMLFNMAVGIADETGAFVGGVMWTGYNGSDVEIHYVGPGTLKRRIVRMIFGISALHFRVNRVTIRTRKEHMSRGVLKLGAVYEGLVKRLYGPTDGPEHAGKQYAFFREQIEKLAGIKEMNSRS